jgi:hypothetical protein
MKELATYGDVVVVRVKVAVFLLYNTPSTSKVRISNSNKKARHAESSIIVRARTEFGLRT